MKIRLIILLLWLISSDIKAAAVDFNQQSINIALTQEPPNLNTARTTDLVSFFVLGHVNEGLVRYDKRGRISAGVAESWQISGNKMIFKLRRNARWSDGSALTAHDFVFAWRLINDPATAAPYASIMYPIKNAEKIQRGELPTTALGVAATSNHQLEITLENACGYCLAAMVHVAFYPLKETFYKAQGELYAAEAENLLSNGPFRLSSWVHGSRLEMVKNDTYWDSDSVHLKQINVAYITEDNRTRLNLFRDNRIALVRLGTETVREAAGHGMRLKTFVSGGMAYLRFNTQSEKFTGHTKIRQAIRLVFDSDEFVNKVIAVPGYKPTYSFFPSWVEGVDNKFVVEYPVPKPEIQISLAAGLVAEVLTQVGLSEAPSLTLLTVTSPTGAKIAEYLQGRLKRTLGFNIKVDQQIFKQYLVKSEAADFDLSLASWYPDFDDIFTYADLLGSYNGNNRGRYQNVEYDKWLRILQTVARPEARMQAAAQLQNIIVQEVPVLPMAETGSAYIQHPKLKGVVRRVLGADPDYRFAQVVK
ncbi:MAG: peptide ABC transporter substrate-binding protein [Pseudomonadales bacterium]|nr:peptide ABC transporter substrate-binding protein [Pseudomonadales bacterium]